MGEPRPQISKNQREPGAHGEEWIDHALEETFPASDPPAWTCGTEPTPPPEREAPEQTTEEPGPTSPPYKEREHKAEGSSPEEPPEQSAGPRSTNPTVSPATPGREPRERQDRTSPGRPFWDLSPGERRRISAQQASPSAGTEDIEDVVEYSETDLVGRQQTTEGPHEPLPGKSRGPEQREHAGSPGVLLSHQHWTRKALYDKARTLGVKGRSRMSKEELIEAIQSSGVGPRVS